MSKDKEIKKVFRQLHELALDYDQAVKKIKEILGVES